VLAARRYAQLRQLSRADAERRLAALALPSQDQMRAEIEEGYGPVSGLIAQIQQPLLQMTAAGLETLKARILEHWSEIQEIALTVPPPQQFEAWLGAVHGPVRPEDIGLSPEEANLGLRTAHYLRDRFTLNRLAYWLGLTMS
jgi:glycerol-1-phosphate dehydrogenase [NAD(P)+]